MGCGYCCQCGRQWYEKQARVAELADARDLKSPAARHAGSTPAPGTNAQEAAVGDGDLGESGLREKLHDLVGGRSSPGATEPSCCGHEAIGYRW